MKDRRPHVAVALDKKEGNTCAISPTHTDRLGWQAQLLDALARARMTSSKRNIEPAQMHVVPHGLSREMVAKPML
jgi:hypothetical protein